jgi:hypothetical protein
MTLGLHDSRSRRRRSLLWPILKFALLVVFLLALGLFAYEGGSMLAQRDVAVLDEQVAELETRVAELETRNSELEATTGAAESRASEWQERYRREVPEGESKVLFDLVQKRLAGGVEAERLADLIGALSTEQVCDSEPATKRFMVETPLFQGANDAVSFAKNTITVTAEGVTAFDASGNRESWFDPAQPITLRFAEIGGRTFEKSGTLPLRYSIVIGENEYQFSALAGDRGFVKMTGRRCAFP